MMHKHPSFTAWLAMAISIVGFSSVPLFLKHFTHHLDAWTVNGLRYGVAALIWSPVILSNALRANHQPIPWKAAIMPALFNTIGQVGWALAPYHNDAGLMGFVVRTSFLFAMLAGFIMLPAERPVLRHPGFWWGTAVIVAGVVILYIPAIRQAQTTLFGTLILLVTAIFWGLYGVSVRRWMAGYPVRLSFSIISIYTALPLMVLTLCFGQWEDIATLTPATGSLIVVSAAIGIALSHVLLYHAIHALGAVISEGFRSIQPFLTGIGACLLFGEQLTSGQWIGGLLLGAGCVWLGIARNQVMAKLSRN